MKKLIITFIALVFIALHAEAQRTRDALYLKNGSIIYGKLFEISDNRYRIETSDGSIFSFDFSEVEKFIKETPETGGRKEYGGGFSLEAGLLIGAQSTDYNAPFSFNFAGSITSKERNIFSLGSGVEFMGVPFTPVFAEYKYLLRNSRVTPFIFFRGGGLFHLGGDEDYDNPNNQYNKHDYKGGFSGSFGTGVSWGKDGFEPYVSFAYRHAKTSYMQKMYTNYDSKYVTVYNRLEIKFGLSF
jgi:hypothetical protein